MTATITTYPRLVSLTLGDGRAVNLPRTVAGVDTLDALNRALEWATAEDIHTELLSHLHDAKAVGLEVGDAVAGFARWLDQAGRWE